MLLLEPTLEEIRSLLRSEIKNLASPDTSIRITNEDRIPAEAGEEFINLYGATCSNLYPPENITRKERYSLKIGITRRFNSFGPNVTGESLYTYDDAIYSRAKSSMVKRAFEIINLIDGNWTLAGDIRDKAALDGYDFCLLTPLGFSSAEPVIEVEADHFYTEDEVTGLAVGLFLVLNFEGLETHYSKY
jgi:hypothetical protein